MTGTVAECVINVAAPGKKEKCCGKKSGQRSGLLLPQPFSDKEEKHIMNRGQDALSSVSGKAFLMEKRSRNGFSI